MCPAPSRVLVVDDDAGVRRLVASLLERAGHRVVTATSAEEALARAEETAPDFVLLDVVLPDSDGYELCRRLKQRPAFADIPVALMTGRPEAKDIDSAVAAGAVDLLDKPFDEKGLLMRVRLHLQLHEATRRGRDVERQLRHAQKLEAVGQLASGIAHEINTPTQFVGDSVSFLEGCFEDLLPLIAKYREAVGALNGEHAALRAEIAELEETADLDYVMEHVPKALERTFEGLGRVSSIVKAMKEFAHLDDREMCAADLNHAIENALTISRNEYKYVADVVTDFGELPMVMCHLSDLNQVFLNLIVNAAHAIENVVGPSGERGTITIRTHREDDQAVLAFGDTGCGIPEHLRERIFEPFFTTKEVGKGSGQGLALVHSIVVDRHGGTLALESEVGAGTTFILRLPLEG